jgi:hypothetical protein
MNKDVAIQQAKALKATVKSIKVRLIPKLNQYKDNFTPSEWRIIELAMSNYMADISSEAERMEVMASQSHLFN